MLKRDPHLKPVTYLVACQRRDARPDIGCPNDQAGYLKFMKTFPDGSLTDTQFAGEVQFPQGFAKADFPGPWRRNTPMPLG